MQPDSTPGLGTSICHRNGHKKKKKNVYLIQGLEPEQSTNHGAMFLQGVAFSGCINLLMVFAFKRLFLQLSSMVTMMSLERCCEN